MRNPKPPVPALVVGLPKPGEDIDPRESVSRRSRPEASSRHGVSARDACPRGVDWSRATLLRLLRVVRLKNYA